MASFRPPKQWVLSEHETITSFASWQSNIIYHLSLNNEFATYIESTTTWSKQSTTNRGLTDDPNTVEETVRKTATQKKIVLERMLGLIAQFAPSLLRSEIIKRSTSLQWIWKRIRRHYSFSQSEVNFLKLSSIKRQDGERYETLFQRIIAHLEDNLMTVDSGLTHDGAQVTVDEDMSPTTEGLAVYLWLNLIDERLPSYISRVFAHDLQSKSLKDIQPQICAAMDSLLSELSAQEDIQIHYSRSSYPNRRRQHFTPRKTPQGSPNQQKNCLLCKAAGRSYQGHDVSTCWFINKFDKMEIAKALAVDVDDEPDQHPVEQSLPEDEFLAVTSSQQAPTQTAVTQRVQCHSSPFFYAFYQHFTCKVVIDSGATSSLVSAAFVKRVCLKQQPTTHAARQIDKSPLNVLGEVKFNLCFGDKNLPIDALVTDSLDCDVLAGVPFCKYNRIDIHMSCEEISLDGKRICYGSKPDSIKHDIYRAESTILRNNASTVVFPGEYLEVIDSNLINYEGEVAIEPRISSPLQGEWPQASISQVIGGTLRIPNDTNEPVYVTKSQHLATIRRVTIPSLQNSEAVAQVSPLSQPALLTQPSSFSPKVLHQPVQRPSPPIPFSSPVSIDPDNQLTPHEKQQFASLHQSFDNVFNPNFGVYNDRSGRIRAKIIFGPVSPPPRKARLPHYSQSQLQLLQEEADKLESHGVLAKPEVIGVDVKFASPSFLVKKSDGSFRFVTAFNELGQYTRLLPTVSQSCDQVLRRLSSWKYIIKTDLTKAFFQIQVDQSSIPYLGTATPFKGLRVYQRPPMGFPGSSEYLQELTARVFGDYVQQGFVLLVADDLNVGGNSVPELLKHWYLVLQRLHENNLSLSASKTVICPKSTTILGWKWTCGELSVIPHKITPLI